MADSIDHARELSRTRYFWWINYLTDYTDFDFLYEPVPWEKDQRQAWPSQWQKDAETYLVPKQGYTETNYKTVPVLTRLPNLDNWTVPETFDPDTFDFSWHPDVTGPDYIYQFGTQHQRTGGPEYRVAGATDLKFCDQVRGSVKSGATPIIEINHMDDNAGRVAGVVATVRYFDNYKDILTRIANTSEHEYIWIISSCCDYTDFDFSWHPELWQNTMLHVFASSGEKFGDTFYMHVPSFRRRIGQFELLDWYDISFVGPGVPRRPLPVIQHNLDTHVQAIKTIDWTGPLAVFSTDGQVGSVPTVPLWREKTKTVVPLSAGASQVVVPKTAVPYIKQQVYDYPYIDRTQRHMYTDQSLDIVFIDNGEPRANHYYEHLKLCTDSNNKLHRSSGVNGRAAAYRAAAELSTTPWFFAVFAKLEVSTSFDWAWQPDRLQEPKHYIFQALNPVNGLVYGHQALIAYNRELVLNNAAEGLDFTLDQAHEVVPVLSGTANYHTDAWTCWRTAFRECIKLKASLPDVENEYRLNIWLTKDNTNEQWSLKGATDAVEYYTAVNGEFAELKKSYDWAWLASYALIKHNLTPNQ